MIPEVTIVAVLVGLGVAAYRDIVALRRADPAFFRRGVVVLRLRSPLLTSPDQLHEPRLSPSFFGWRATVVRLGPREIGFTAPCTNAPVMRGQLLFDPLTGSVVITGRLLWGVMPLFMAMCVVAALFEPRSGLVLTGVLLLYEAVVYWAERRRFASALRDVVAQARTDAGGAG